MVLGKNIDNDDELKMKRVEVPAANELIGKKFEVLDHGFVALVDYMGSDSSIVQAARVSYGAGTKSVNDDKGLIRYLMRHEHTTPFEMVEFKFLARMPIFVARQWVRHRTASINEYSARYSILKDDFYVPSVDALQAQSTLNRQGREYGRLSPEAKLEYINDIKVLSENAYTVYKKLIDGGVARELARMVLPVNIYTEWYWKSNLHNIFHFLTLRLDPHAQWETRQYAARIGDIVKVVAPIAYGAFEDFTLNSIKLSSKEQAAIKSILNGSSIEAACASSKLLLRKEDGKPVKSGEGPEFLAKLERIKGNKISES